MMKRTKSLPAQVDGSEVSQPPLHASRQHLSGICGGRIWTTAISQKDAVNTNKNLHVSCLGC